jgi:hypothetical protein
MYNSIITTVKSVSICVLSSTLFLLNAAICWYYDLRIYSELFLVLTATSVLYHTHPSSRIYNIIDKLAVLAVVLYGGYTFYDNWEKYTQLARTMIIATFTSTIVLFSGGYAFGVFCYDPVWNNVWHSILHGISVLGHALIVVLV